MLSSTSINISWAPPNEEDHNGVIVYYTINVTVQETRERFQLHTDDLMIKLTDLQPYRTHIISASASTSVCQGQLSSEISARTLEDGNSDMIFTQLIKSYHVHVCICRQP